MSDQSDELFVISVSQLSPGLIVVALTGEMDIANAPQLASRVVGFGGTGRDRVVIDLSELTFIDSTGINALVSAVRSVEAVGGSVIVAAPTPHVRQVFDIVRLSDVVALEQSLDVAIARSRHDLNGTGP